MAKFKEVLKDRNFFFLWLGQIISQFGDRLNQMALIALIYARAPGSTFQLAKILSFTIIPVFLVGPIAASYVDRWDRRRTMIFCDLLRAVLVALIVLFFIKFESIWPIYIIVFIVFSVSRFFIPAKMAIIPELVSQDKLLLANSLTSTTGMIAAVAGFGLGGLIVERVGSYGGFLIDALTYLVSGLFILMIAARAVSYFKREDLLAVVKDVEKRLRKTLFAEIKEGWQFLAKDRDARFVAQMFFLLWSALGAVYVVIIVFVQKTFGSVTQDLGLLAMFLGMGLFSGSLIYGRFGEKLSKIRTVFISLGVSGIVLSAFAVFLKVFASTLFAAGLSFILGLTLAPIVISSHTLIHEVTEEKLRGRIFGTLEIVAHLGFLLFMFLSSFLAERIGRFWILLSVGIIFMIVGLGAIVLKVDKKYA
ncbi:MAG: MFS transporter [Candidatus Omnitrophica bacterium]|nr:MFS transporter [Candidatus Omnitrophota bacterium]